MTPWTRRSLLAGSSAAAIAVGPASAAVSAAGSQAPGVYRTRLGSFELTALYDGTWYRKIDDKFVRNASAAEVDKALTDAFLQPGIVPTSFTALLVNTGSKLVLIDAGTGGQFGPTTGYLREGSRRRRRRAEGHRYHLDLAFPSRPHQRHQGQGRRQGLRQCRDPGAGAGMGVLDGRRQHERGAGGDAAAVSQRAPHFPRHRRRGETLRAGQRRSPPASPRSPPSATRPATPRSRSPPATSRCWCSATPPTIPGCSRAIRNGRRYFDIDGAHGGRDPQAPARPRRGRPMLVQGYHFPFPASGYIVQDRDRLRRRAGDVAAVLRRIRRKSGRHHGSFRPILPMTMRPGCG